MHRIPTANASRLARPATTRAVPTVAARAVGSTASASAQAAGVSRVDLHDRWFGDAGNSGTTIVTAGDSLSASLFRYGSGVAGVRIENGAGSVELLPFQGQAIWRAKFGGEELTMKSMFEEPRPVSQNKQWGYLDTYGAFMLHCGALAMGCPGAEDTHQLHGELPNAPYQDAFLEVGEDDRGRFIAMSGTYDHSTAFTHNYRATPSVRIYEGETTMPISLNIANRFHQPMELMYMCHVNFRPVEGSRLVYSAPTDGFAVRSTFPDHVNPSQEHKDFLAELQRDPALHTHLTPEVMACMDPEVVAYLDYQSDPDGWAHSMQVLPSGKAHYLKHQPAVLDKGVRWMVIDGSQQAMGLVLPATAHPEGRTEELRKGNVRYLAPGDSTTFEVEAGLLTEDAVPAVEAAIGDILG